MIVVTQLRDLFGLTLAEDPAETVPKAIAVWNAVWPAEHRRARALPGSLLDRMPMRSGGATVIGPPLFHGTGLIILENTHNMAGGRVTPERAPGISAVAYFFAKRLREELGVPVYRIVASIGEGVPTLPVLLWMPSWNAYWPHSRGCEKRWSRLRWARARS